MNKYIINPLRKDLENNVKIIYATTFEKAIGIYAKMKEKKYTNKWFDIKDKPRTAYIGNSFQITDSKSIFVFALI